MLAANCRHSHRRDVAGKQNFSSKIELAKPGRELDPIASHIGVVQSHELPTFCPQRRQLYCDRRHFGYWKHR